MKHPILFLCSLFPLFMFSQSIQVDSQSFTPQELIEDILIDSNCIDAVVVTNVVGGDFGGSDQSYGYFDATNTSFPFEEGILLSTGRLQNTQGPNTSLSDDDAPGWAGDADLEMVLNESNTINATILEFQFSSSASEISFRYIFASEEYQEGNPNTCQFSDLFGFLIRPLGEQQYENIALVPDTDTPVKVTTVHPEIPNGCPAENEFFFESFNGANVPINFNGQTKVIEATAQIIPNTTYEVKLVIADEQNFRFDSAVFLEAGSFELATELGPNRLLSTGNALCENETLTLDATEADVTGYTWFRDGIVLPAETSAMLVVDTPGFYEVTVGLQNGCESFGEIVIEFADTPIVVDVSVEVCDIDQDGSLTYNLFSTNDAVTNNDSSIFISDFFLDVSDAMLDVNSIPTPTAYEITNPGETLFARVENQPGCFAIAEVTITLTTTVTPLQIDPFQLCDETPIDGFASFSLPTITATFNSQLPADAVVQYYETQNDASLDENRLSSPFINTLENNQEIFVRVFSETDCIAISSVLLEVFDTPVLADGVLLNYCLNDFPSTIELDSGVLGNTNGLSYSWTFNGSTLAATTSSIAINEPGNYMVTVTNNNGCSSTRSISVQASDVATIESITVEDQNQSTTVTVMVSGQGDYEYALDNVFGPYVELPVFTDVSSGFHTVYVRDRNGCGIITGEVAVIGFPNFFTPNGDGIHDTWKVDGATNTLNPTEQFVIFDRYGKILFSRRRMGNGWDGTYQGEIMPSNDYWYLITFTDGRTFRGHFSLIKRGG
ncbi:choice-of-anchor L domain-containing protein [uncultured Dokdonia sp.]|uniref:choice-of-anchor L domain-containing protein n=1 Tax=uncultured Dokdonia sp. TaxID=575653 RepID=UPI00260F19F6|nr:choice-of-anchor L domain-containing protein [uncultured Dokdonia sp.]